MTTIIKTQPHGAQAVTRGALSEQSSDPITKQTFLIDTAEGSKIVMTGEELTSLARQWLEFSRPKVRAS